MSRSAFASIHWDEKGVPYGTAFDDHYFCADNGYEEAVHVGVLGNALPERFRGLDPGEHSLIAFRHPEEPRVPCEAGPAWSKPQALDAGDEGSPKVPPGDSSPRVRGPRNDAKVFTIIETGFGTGLDLCCAWEAWDAFAPASWKLSFVSLELFPVRTEDVGRALGLWPKLAKYREALLAQYAPSPGGVQKMSFAGGRVHLAVVFDEAVSALKRIREGGLAPNGADAWFLDGFGPSKNPDMWREEVFTEVAALSRPGTTFSTFTVAGHVRRLLTKHGFAVQKVPAHGKKRQMLAGTFQ